MPAMTAILEAICVIRGSSRLVPAIKDLCRVVQISQNNASCLQHKKDPMNKLDLSRSVAASDMQCLNERTILHVIMEEDL